MKTVSSAVRRAIENEIVPSITITMAWQTGATQVMERIVDGSVVRRRGFSEGGTFAPGGCNIGSFEFSFFDDDDLFDSADWSNSKFVVKLTYDIGNDETEDISFGKYYVGSHSKTGNICQVLGYDAMAYLDRQMLTADDLGTSYYSGITLINKIVENTPLTKTGANAQGLFKLAEGEKITKRQMLAEILALNNYFAFIDDDENLVVRAISYYRYGTDFYIDDLPIYQENISRTLIYGYRLTNGKEELYIGDESAHAINVQVSHAVWTTNIKRSINRSFREMVGAYVYYGTLRTRSDPRYEPGDRMYDITKWENTDKFYLSQIVWEYGAVSETIQSDANPPEMQDLRSIGGESSYDDTQTVFASGSITLSNSSSSGDYYKVIDLEGIVPADYRRSYVFVGTPTSGTITKVTEGTANIIIHGDTQGMVVNYTISKKTVENEPASATSLTNYGALAQQHLAETQGGYTL